MNDKLSQVRDRLPLIIIMLYSDDSDWRLFT